MNTGGYPYICALRCLLTVVVQVIVSMMRMLLLVRSSLLVVAFRARRRCFRGNESKHEMSKIGLIPEIVHDTMSTNKRNNVWPRCNGHSKMVDYIRQNLIW